MSRHRIDMRVCDWRSTWAFWGAILVAVTLSSCGGGKASDPVAVAFATVPLAPPASLGLSQIASFAAVVTGDSTAQGVNWTVTCTPANAPQASCGTITSHTASGYPTIYAAPINYNEKTVPVGGTVTITAIAAADPTKNV